MLWPGENALVQRNRLRYELSQVRHVLGKEWVCTKGQDWVGVCAEIPTDLANSPKRLPSDFLPLSEENWVLSARREIRLNNSK